MGAVRRVSDPSLHRVELVVPTTECHEVVVPAAFDDLAVLENEDEVGPLDRRQTVCDHDRRPTTEQIVEAGLDQRLAFRIETRSRLVEEE